ncbi:unnamed protein product [Linum tenue]|uniref:Uncharacterized protein n=1 Tax=Linum tenue TaxID=586396 RepID=A0AAV0Q283_9ROSI|nr:unnamed protein product [Linum tenue]
MGANGTIEKSTVECLKVEHLDLGEVRSHRSLRLHSPDHRYWHELRAEAPPALPATQPYMIQIPLQSIHLASSLPYLSNLHRVLKLELGRDSSM